MSEGRKNIIAGFLDENDINTAKGIGDTLKDGLHVLSGHKHFE